MPSIRKTVTEICRSLNHSFRFLPTESIPLSKTSAFSTFKKTRVSSQIVFTDRCLHKRLIPKGFRINFLPATGGRRNKRFNRITNSCSRRLMQTTVQNLQVIQKGLSVLLMRFRINYATPVQPQVTNRGDD